MPRPLPATGQQTPTDRLVEQFGTWMTVAEVAALLKVSTMTVYRLAEAGDLGSIRVGRSVRITERSVAHYLAGGGSDQELYPPAAEPLRAVGGRR